VSFDLEERSNQDENAKAQTLQEKCPEFKHKAVTEGLSAPSSIIRTMTVI
jgi:hypothetical protein